MASASIDVAKIAIAAAALRCTDSDTDPESRIATRSVRVTVAVTATLARERIAALLDASAREPGHHKNDQWLHLPPDDGGLHLLGKRHSARQIGVIPVEF